MGEINLREFYPEIYKEDYVVSLPAAACGIPAVRGRGKSDRCFGKE